MDDQRASREIADVILVRDVRVDQIPDPLADHRLKDRLDSEETIEDYRSFELVYRS